MAKRLWKMTLAVLGAVVVLLGAGVLVGCCAFSAPRYQGPISDHFDGKRFVHPWPVEQHGFKDVLRWQFDRNRERGPWRQWVQSEPGPPPPRRVEPGEVRVTFVNHATVLLQVDGLNLLTDPIWSERASPVSFAGPRRIRAPGLRFEDLPPIDAVLVSHNHYDHLDLPTLRRLQRAFSPPVFAGLGNAKLFASKGVGPARDLDWWDSVELGQGVRLWSVPVQHFSSRGLCDRDAVLWNGWVLEREGGYLYIGGDTGFGPHFQQVRDRFGEARLAVLPIGAYQPEWFMLPVHLNPDQAVQAHRVLGARTSVAMHYGTFRLADEGEHDPVERLRQALLEQGVSEERFWVLGFGEGRAVP